MGSELIPAFGGVGGGLVDLECAGARAVAAQGLGQSGSQGGGVLASSLSQQVVELGQSCDRISCVWNTENPDSVLIL